MALDYSVIGQRIKQARLAKNLTQEDLAEQIDISVAFLSRVERGNSHINLKRLNQLCRLLDVSEGYILNGASSNSTNYLCLADTFFIVPPSTTIVNGSVKSSLSNGSSGTTCNLFFFSVTVRRIASLSLR